MVAIELSIGQPNDQEGQKAADRLFQEYKDSTVEVSRYNWWGIVPTARYTGAGFFVRTGTDKDTGQGFCDVATMDHILQDANGTPSVKTTDGQSYSTKVLKEDAASGIALLRIENVKNPDKTCKAIPLAADSDELQEGDRVVKVTPNDGEWRADYGTFRGFVSRQAFRVRSSPGLDMSQKIGVFQIPGGPGDSGAPIMNTKGLGMFMTEGGGWGVEAVPSYYINRILNETR